MVNLLLAGRKLSLGAAIDDMNLGAEPERGAGCIHCDIAATHYAHLLASVDRGQIVVAVCAHKIVAGQELIGGEHAAEILSRDAHKLRKTGAGADEHGLEAHLVKEFVDGYGAANEHVGLNLHAEFLNVGDFVGEDLLLREAELRNAVLQHAAGFMESLVDGHVIAPLREVGSAGKAGRAGADDGHLDAILLNCGSGRLRGRIGAHIVSDEALKLADCDSFALHAEHAASLALSLLRTHAAAHCRQRRVLLDYR